MGIWKILHIKMMIRDLIIHWKVTIIYVLGSLLQLFTVLYQFESIDWLTQWQSALEILDGTPFYYQNANFIDGRLIYEANHFPIFFYTLAGWITVFGESMIIARLLLFLFSQSTFWLFFLILKPSTTNQKIWLVLVYFLNPLHTFVNLLAIFDMYMLLFMIGGLYLAVEKKPVFAGIILFLGTFIKFIPIIGFLTVVIYYFQQTQKQHLTIFVISYLVPTMVTIAIFIRIYGFFFISRTLGFQFYRYNPNLSIWYNFLPFQIDPSIFLIFQATIFLALIVVILTKVKLESFLDLTVTTSFLIALFILLLRNSYGHYGVWWSILMIPALLESFTKKQSKLLGINILSTVIYFSGNLICLYSCFDSPNPVSWLVKTHTLFLFVGILVQFAFTHLHFKTKSKSINMQ